MRGIKLKAKKLKKKGMILHWSQDADVVMTSRVHKIIKPTMQ